MQGAVRRFADRAHSGYLHCGRRAGGATRSPITPPAGTALAPLRPCHRPALSVRTCNALTPRCGLLGAATRGAGKQTSPRGEASESEASEDGWRNPDDGGMLAPGASPVIYLDLNHWYALGEAIAGNPARPITHRSLTS